ncbi:MAG: signal peptidase I [Acidimicrobiia bacterium]|nr:signal peptidase I [Acidimicrobiia bacterium]
MAFRMLIVAAIGLIGGRVAQIYRRFEVAERSMEPTLSAGDYVVASRYVDRMQLGDIVVFEHPQQGGFWLVKRVIGVAGDVVVIDDGRVTRNGAAVDGLNTPGQGTWKVPAGALFVLGDNRQASSGDSRSLGPVSIGLVDGVVVFRYWPIPAFGPPGPAPSATWN